MINKENFIFVLSQIEKQIEKERKLINFLSDGYIDGHLVSTFSESLIETTIKLLSAFFEDNAFSDKSITWIEWFIFDNDFGKGGLSAFINKKEYKFSNSSEFYNFLITWKNIDNENN
jgi:hypothetical protein